MAQQAFETALYAPVKRFLEGLGFSVKGEIGGCDLVALRGGEPPLVVVCELKLRFNLELLLQGVDRAGSCDEVWLAARLAPGGKRQGDARFLRLCRRLGFGLLGVDAADAVHVLLPPDAPMPRRDPKRRSRLVAEHRRRQGDPQLGGGSRQPVMTAYRQRALACARRLADGPRRPRDLTPEVADAAAILYRNVYGWFERPRSGWYALSAKGRDALQSWPMAADAPADQT